MTRIATQSNSRTFKLKNKIRNSRKILALSTTYVIMSWLWKMSRFRIIILKLKIQNFSFGSHESTILFSISIKMNNLSIFQSKCSSPQFMYDFILIPEIPNEFNIWPSTSCLSFIMFCIFIPTSNLMISFRIGKYLIKLNKII